ncbi:hypothetical protein [Klebsiella aerogenes]|uniref:hypothetical protein n=1 Tax=Klebsiella aerogenes TaxID=548 RepID=UPI002DB8D981|nr:hypothetical protein [Klebsiella aerogenes]MEB7619113.1 hypothetical protein [Klebsiella aerogenes]
MQKPSEQLLRHGESPMAQKKRKKPRIKDLYAITFLILLIIQVVAVNAVFICVGLGFLSLSGEVLKIFAGCTMSQICGIVYCIVRSLFRARK